MARRDGAAKAAGVMLLPGAASTWCRPTASPPTSSGGYDGDETVPRLPGEGPLLARHRDDDGREPAARRRRAARRRPPPRPAAWRVRRLDFGDGRVRAAMTIPWGDVSTAYYSTGIPDVEVYTAAPAAARFTAWLSRYLAPPARLAPRAGLPEAPHPRRRAGAE